MGIVRTALRRSLRSVRHVTPVRPRAARGAVAAVYARVEADFGLLAAPVALHSPSPTALSACWTLLRETLIASGAESRAAKEAVAAAVSRQNDCPYCVTVHAATLDRLSDRPPVEVAPPLAEVGAELLGVVVAFHYLNRMVNVFLEDSPLPAGAPAFAEGLLGRFMVVGARRAHPPGVTARLLPAAPLPPDLAWAAATPAVGDALGRVAAAFEAGGRRTLSDPARELVTARIAAWDGTPPGLDRGWVREAVRELPTDEQPGAALALLVAFASYQVDDAAVTAVGGGDAALVELAGWAAFSAARRMAALAAQTTGV
ncbi:carboxymuconolactone decarboxylase family protein [Actinosynnema sp. NPDC050436]|uniref:carboxymuconolactone decarboxylase family protein n=1 Tax=Actinosynnema sp. NPDC050436 TaxID=3155659 RepID=UPI0033ED2058